MELPGTRVVLRTLTEDDVTERYLGWMNDAEVNRYLESRFCEHSLESLRAFVRSLGADHHFFGIWHHGEHIGNIKLGPIHRYHRQASVGIIIGEKTWWGHGLATEAIEILTRYAFETLDLEKLTAGCYSTNEGSARAFIKAGWCQEGVRPQQYRCGDTRVDEILLGCVRKDRLAVPRTVLHA